jgi:hypothetical protein
VDFLTARAGKPEFLLEVKTSKPELPAIKHFAGVFGKQVESIILVKDLQRELFIEGIKIKKASSWLQSLEA